jgi:hypothetical protein
MVPVAQPVENDIMGLLGWVTAVVLVAFMLPMLAFLYLDILNAKHEVKRQTEQIEKLRRQMEKKERDKNPDTFTDNPLFDRVRRPFSLPVPRSKELGGP